MLIAVTILLSVFAIIAWVLIVFGWWLYSCRLVRIIIVAIFFGVLTLMIDCYLYINCLPAIIFVLIVSGIAAANRINMIRLLAGFLIIYWVLLVFLSPLCAQFINRHAQVDEPNRKELVKFEPAQATYDFMINELGDEKLTKTQFCNIVSVIMPEDVEKFLRGVKTREFYLDRYAPFFFRTGMSPEVTVGLTEEKEKQKKLTDLDLRFLIQRCGRDATGIITGFIDEPNNPWALVSRSMMDDMTAKKPLEEYLQAFLKTDPNLDDINDYGEMIRYGRGAPRGRYAISRADSNLRDSNDRSDRGRMPSPYLRSPNASEMTAALAVISEPNEAVSRYLDYVQRRNMCDLLNDYHFFENVVLLPTSQARQVIKAYLVKAAEWQQAGPTICREGTWHVSPDIICSPLRDIVGVYADREISEKILTILQGTENDDWFYGWNVWPHLTIESAELIKKGLASGNDKFRAWSVWQLRNVGYKFTQEEIDKLLKDESWIVRANAVMAEPQRAKNIAANDKNSFVRFVATLSANSH